MTATANTCFRHPNRETGLRCNRCDRYICASCAVGTPTGYRCPECIREQKKNFNTALTLDYVLAFSVAGVLSFVGGYLIQQVGFFVIYLTLFAGPSIGIFIAEAVRRVTGKRRSKALFMTAVAGVVAGGLALAADELFYMVLYREQYFLSGLILPAVYTVLAAVTTYRRLSGIHFRY